MPNLKKLLEYRSWVSMRRRCNKKNDAAYRFYGARGIAIDPTWDNFKTFQKDMGPRPSVSHTLDRIDNSKGYSKENCRWATKLEQTLNRRIAKECFKGHPWTEENSMFATNGRKKTSRRCRICYENRLKTYYTRSRKHAPK